MRLVNKQIRVLYKFTGGFDMHARIIGLRSCGGERHGGQLAARAPHGRGVAGRPRRPSENMTGPQTTNMSATPAKSRNHREACVMQTVTHPRVPLAAASQQVRLCHRFMPTAPFLQPRRVPPRLAPLPPRSEQLEMPYEGTAVTWCRPLPSELNHLLVLVEPWQASARPEF